MILTSTQCCSSGTFVFAYRKGVGGRAYILLLWSDLVGVNTEITLAMDCQYQHELASLESQESHLTQHHLSSIPAALQTTSSHDTKKYKSRCRMLPSPITYPEIIANYVLSICYSLHQLSGFIHV